MTRVESKAEWDIMTALKKTGYNAGTAELQAMTKGQYTLDGIRRILSKHDFTPKKASRTAHPCTPRVCEARVASAKALLKLLKCLPEGYEFIWLDECTFDRGALQDRCKIWTKRGTRAVNPHRSFARGPSVNLILFRGNRGFSRTIVQQERLKAYIFRKFLTNILNSYDGPSEHLVIGMDNCPAHKAKIIQRFEQEFRPKNKKHPNLTFQFFWLPPYTPQMNPCELFFNDTKGEIVHSPPRADLNNKKVWQDYVQKLIHKTVWCNEATFKYTVDYCHKIIKAKGDLKVLNQS